MATSKESNSDEFFIHSDILHSIFSRLPIIHLLPASLVSTSWNRAVFFSLRRLRIKPWLLFFSHTITPPYAITALAYDPRSHVWIRIKPAAPVHHLSPVRSSHSTLLYSLSPSRFSFSVDPLHLTWHHVPAPRFWRIDPTVAAVGRFVVVAGGVCEFEDDALAVELFDTDSGTWETCESMPEMLKDSAASTWLSVAASSDKMYVTEKRSGMAYSFDPKTRSWTELIDFCPVSENGHCCVYSRAISFAGDHLIIAGITGDEENPTGIELWEVAAEFPGTFERIGCMPKECLKKLRGEDHSLTSITLNAVGDMLYIHNNHSPETGEIVAAEMSNGKLCNWRGFRNANAATHRLVVGCSNVGFSDLRNALRERCSFSIVP